MFSTNISHLREIMRHKSVWFWLVSFWIPLLPSRPYLVGSKQHLFYGYKCRIVNVSQLVLYFDKIIFVVKFYQ